MYLWNASYKNENVTNSAKALPVDTGRFHHTWREGDTLYERKVFSLRENTHL